MDTEQKRRYRVAAAEAMELLLTPDGKRSAEVLRHGTLQVKIYSPRGADPQTPHTRDEVYCVISGSGTYIAGTSQQAFGPHDVLFAPAGLEHRFIDFSDDFSTWVFFYGPDGGERPDSAF